MMMNQGLLKWIRKTSPMNRRTKFRLKLVTWLDRMLPGKYCWPDCVIWAMYKKNWNPFSIDSAEGCKEASIHHEHELCYCGVWYKGQCWTKLSNEEREAYKAGQSESDHPKPGISPLYECKECGEMEEDVSDGLCMVCWEMEHHPETFVISDQDNRDWDECATYIQKHNLTPNLDIPE